MGSLTTRDGRRLAFVERGSGPLLVCHPGGPGFAGDEFGDLAGLDDSFRLVLLDPRGTGGSDRAPSYALAGDCDDLDDLLDGLGAGRARLLGFSHGGTVAIEYAATRPERVERLVLASAFAHAGEEQQEEMRRLLESYADEPWYPDAVAAIEAEEAGAYATSAEFDRLWRAMAPLYFAAWGERERAYVASTRFGDVEALRAFNADLPDLRPRLGQIAAETLVLAGERDFICGPAQARLIAEGIRGARLVVLPDAGHMTFLEQPAAFRNQLLAFL